MFASVVGSFASLFATFGFCLPLLDFKYLVVVSNVKMKINEDKYPR